MMNIHAIQSSSVLSGDRHRLMRLTNTTSTFLRHSLSSKNFWKSTISKLVLLRKHNHNHHTRNHRQTLLRSSWATKNRGRRRTLWTDDRCNTPSGHILYLQNTLRWSLCSWLKNHQPRKLNYIGHIANFHRRTVDRNEHYIVVESAGAVCPTQPNTVMWDSQTLVDTQSMNDWRTMQVMGRLG